MTANESKTLQINGTNVVFSVIDAVLQSPGNFSATAAAAHNTTQFIQDAVSTNLLDTFDNQHGITLFVPTGEYNRCSLSCARKLMQEMQMLHSPLPTVLWRLCLTVI